MDFDINFSPVSAPIFDGENYQISALRMETYKDALYLSKVVEEDYDIQTLLNYPTTV